MKKENVCFWQHYNAEEQADAIQGFAAMLYEMPAAAMAQMLTSEQMEYVSRSLKQSAQMFDELVLVQRFTEFCAKHFAKEKEPC